MTSASIYFERIMARSVKQGECLVWTGSTQPTGYGQAWNGNRPEQTHRIVYRHVHGEIPSGLEIDHICKNRTCVNPDHLRAVTHRENMMNSDTVMRENADKVFCKRGHELSGSNLRIDRKGGRICRKCIALHASNARARRKLCI